MQKDEKISRSRFYVKKSFKEYKEKYVVHVKGKLNTRLAYQNILALKQAQQQPWLILTIISMQTSLNQTSNMYVSIHET